MINTVIFDLSGVIVTRINRVGDLLQPILNVSKEKIHSKLKNEDFQEFLKGKITEDEYWGLIIKKNGWNVSIQLFKRLIRENFQEIRGTREIIIGLRNKGFKTGLLSSHTFEWVCFLREKFGYEKYFDSVLYSFQAGRTKPDKRIYKQILKNIGVNAEECLYIDDKEKFLKPAKELGMNTILFHSPEQLEKEPIITNILEQTQRKLDNNVLPLLEEKLKS